MRSRKQKNPQQQMSRKQINSQMNLVSNPLKAKAQQNLEKQANKRFKSISQYSSQKLKEIELQISKLNSLQLSKNQMAKFIDSIICLMCWIWQSESIEYKAEMIRKRTKKIAENQEEIDRSKCLRKLLQLYNKNPQIFAESIFLNKDIMQRTGIKTKNHKNNLKPSNSSKSINQKDIETQNSEEITTIKTFFIYDFHLNTEKFRKYSQQIPLITLLVEIIVLSYDSIVVLDEHVARSVIARFTSDNKKINDKKGSYIKQKILQELIIFTFSELYFLKIVQVPNKQGIHYINKKRRTQSVLWRYFSCIVKILQFHLKQNKIAEYDLQVLEILKSAHTFVSQFTYYVKKNCGQITQIKVEDLESFFEIFIITIIEAEYLFSQIKGFKNKQTSDSQEVQIINYKFGLLLFDWAILSIRNVDNQFFSNVMKFCKKMFFQGIDQKNIQFKKSSKNKYRSNEPYENFIIKEDPNEFSEGKSRSDEKQNLKRQSQKEINQNIQNDHPKNTIFTSVPHMRLLTFKENVPLSAQRRLERKLESKKQGQQDCLTYLLILLNRQYIMQLLQEIQFIEAEQLDPDIGKGLVKLCTYCNKFTSLILSERYFKILSSKPHHRNLLQSVFQTDINHQRRLSQSRNSYHSKNKGLQTNEIQSLNQNSSKIVQKREANLEEEALKVRLSSCESIFFEMITQIQTKIPLLKLSTYIDEALKKPQIFRAEVFYQKLTEYQHPCYAREYLNQLIIRWIDYQLRFFNILTYFDIFFKCCLFSQDQETQLSLFVEELPISKLTKLHCQILTQTFTEQNISKLTIPEGISTFEKLQILTSGGFEQKTRLIDKQFNEMTEIILWNKYLKVLAPLQRQDKYVYIKSYFTLIFYSFSLKENDHKNDQKLIYLVEKLKIDIQKDRVDEVCSIFHFLSLALFPNKQFLNFNVKDLEGNKKDGENKSLRMRSYTNGKQKIIEQILYIIRQNSRQIIDMFKNKESLTIKCLTQDMRRKTSNNVNSDVEDMKRKQVGKMLNKQKLMHDYLIKTIIRFLQNIEYTESLLRNLHSPEQFISIVAQICKREYLTHQQKMLQTDKILYTPKLNYFLSSVSSGHHFQMSFRKELKRFQESFEKHHSRLSFLIMIRFIAQKWIQEKSILLKTFPQQKVKSKQTKISKVTDIDSRSKNKISSITDLISIQGIFKICFSIMQIHFETSKIIRQSEVLKQKIISLQTVCLLSNFIIQNTKYLLSSYSSVLKTYRTHFHSKLGQIIIKFLMNNELLLGKNERQLINFIRIQALSHIIEHYTENKLYENYEWKFLKDKKSFWFLINCLIFDKAPQIRFFILKSLQSRFSISQQFKSSMHQKLILFQLMSVEQPFKLFTQLAKKSLTETLEYCVNLNSTKGIDFVLNSLVGCIQFVVNFNLTSLLQKNVKYLNEKQFFELLIDIIFDKNQMQAYFYSLVQSFKILINNKSTNQLLKILQPLDWSKEINIAFYLTSKRNINRYNFNDREKQQNKKLYFQLLNELKQEAQYQSDFNKKNNLEKEKNNKNSKVDNKKVQQIQNKFLELLLQTLKAIEEVFKSKCARLNKRFIKSKKPIYRIFDTPIAPNLSFVLNQTYQKQGSGQNIRQSEEEIQI